MGWWEQDQDGNSFALGSGMLWGDGPADIMGDAIEQIAALFLAEGGRKPTVAELKAGLLFSLGSYDEPTLRDLATNVGPSPEGQPTDRTPEELAYQAAQIAAGFGDPFADDQMEAIEQDLADHGAEPGEEAADAEGT